MKNQKNYLKLAPLALTLTLLHGCNDDVDCTTGCYTPISDFSTLDLTVREGHPKLLNFAWTNSAESDKGRMGKGVTYTVCQRDDTADGECKAIAQTKDQLDLDVNTPDILESLQSQFFIQASNGRDKAFSNDMSIPKELAEKIIGYYKASEPELLSMFGASVSLSEKGNIMAIGSPVRTTVINDGNTEGEDRDIRVGHGTVDIYEMVNGKWAKQAEINPPKLESGAFFGRDVSLSNNGKTIAISEPFTLMPLLTMLISELVQANSLDSDSSADIANKIQELASKLTLNSHQSESFVDSVKAALTKYQVNSAIRSAVSNPSAKNLIEFFDVIAGLAIEALPESVSEKQKIELKNVLDQEAKKSVNSYLARTEAEQEEVDKSMQGSVHIYHYNEMTKSWDHAGEVLSPEGYSLDTFGAKIKLDAAGDTLAVTAPGHLFEKQKEDGTTNITIGAAFIFEKSNGAWTQEAMIRPRHTRTEDTKEYVEAPMALSMDLSGDGQTFAINAATMAHIAVFEKSASAWELTDAVTSYSEEADFDGNSLPLLGLTSLSLNHDGTKMAVGDIGYGMTTEPTNEESPVARKEATHNTILSGQVSVLEKTGETWELTANLIEPVPRSITTLGMSVAMDATGKKVIAGAPFTSFFAKGLNTEVTPEQGEEPPVETHILSGAAHAFALGSDGTWNHYGQLSHPLGTPIAFLGAPVAISDDGTTLSAGAPFESNGLVDGVQTPDDNLTPNMEGEEVPCQEDGVEVENCTETVYPDVKFLSGAAFVL